MASRLRAFLTEGHREPKELVLVGGVGHVPPPEDRIPAINSSSDVTLGPVRARRAVSGGDR